MTILITCLLITMLLPYIVKLMVGSSMKQAGGYDNHYPRVQQAQLKGFGARAVGAQQNCFESLIVFSVAALTALITGHVSWVIQTAAIIYIVSRIIYVFCYLLDYATLRSLIWLLGWLCCVFILGSCLSSVQSPLSPPLSPQVARG